MRSSKSGMMVKTRGWISVLLVGLLLAVYAGRVQAAVTLTSFTASAQEDFILIEWETATELNNAGFYIQRSTQSESGYARITDLIASLSQGVTGAQYQYEDHTASAGIIYYYKLEALNLSSGSEFYGPISQSWGVSATQTATSTQSASATATSQGAANTSTPTPTGTAGPTNTATSTAIPSPTRTATSFVIIATSTPTPSQTPSLSVPSVTLQGTVFASPTTTLLPLPSITLIFPVLTATQTPTATQIETPAASPTPTDMPKLIDEPLPTRWKVAAALLVVLWILLAGFLTILIRRMSLP